MQDAERSQNGAQDDPNTKENGDAITLTGIASAAILFFIIVSFGIGVVVTDYITDGGERTKVIFESLFSLAIVIAVAIQTGLYFRQAKVLDAQLTESMEFRAQTERSAGLDRKIARYANRAYVIAKMRGTSKEPSFLQFRLRIENSGHTPATKVRVHFTRRLDSEPPHYDTGEKFVGSKDPVVVFDSGLTESEPLGVIAPHRSYEVVEAPIIGPLTPTESQQWEAGALSYYCWGSIVYEDIFNDTWETRFCFEQSQKHPRGYPCKHGSDAY
jgi:hypothetical protein